MFFTSHLLFFCSGSYPLLSSKSRIKRQLRFKSLLSRSSVKLLKDKILPSSHVGKSLIARNWMNIDSQSEKILKNRFVVNVTLFPHGFAMPNGRQIKVR